ncbi:MAG: DUF2306 domain-containing protein [Archangium sp.]
MNKRIVGLMLLSAVPMLAGLSRLFDMSTSKIGLEGTARFMADPLTGIVHMVGATCFATLGALQFIRGRSWHRVLGRVLGVFGITSAIAGVVMALSWKPKLFDSAALNAIRVVVATAMVAFIVAGYVTARRRDFEAHGRWMTRAYALFLGGGTQFFTAGFTALPFMEPFLSEGLYAACMAAGWIINVVFAEWVLLTPSKGPRAAHI